MNYERFTLDERMVLRYVVPFYFDDASAGTGSERYGQLCRALEEAPLWQAVRPDRKERDVYDHIVRSVYSDSGSPAIGSSWRYDFKNRKKTFRYAEKKDGAVYHYWTVQEAGVYLFKSEVGFFWYEVAPVKKRDVPLMNAGEFIVFQNSFKELCRRNRGCILEEAVPRTCREDAERYREFHPGRWVCGLLEPILGRIGFQEACRIRMEPEDGTEISAPDKALIFQYLLMDTAEPKPEDPARLREMAYLLSSGQTTKYNIPDDLAEQSVSPFGGVCWHAAKSGCGYYALRDEKNQAFFSGDLPQRIRENYFLLYILVLHQSCSLANYLRRIAVELPAETEAYTVPSEAGRRLDQLVAEVNTFLMKGMYFSVSGVQHQNVFFEYLQKRLRVREDIAGIDAGTNAVVKLQRLRKEAEEALVLQRQEERERIRQQREEASDRTLNITMGLLSLFAVFSALNDFTQLVAAHRSSPWAFASLLDAETWAMAAEYLKTNAPGSVFVLLGYALIVALSALCICVVTRTSMRHFGIGRHAKNETEQEPEQRGSNG